MTGNAALLARRIAYLHLVRTAVDLEGLLTHSDGKSAGACGGVVDNACEDAVTLVLGENVIAPVVDLCGNEHYLTVLTALVGEYVAYIKGQKIILQSVDSLVAELAVARDGVHKRLCLDGDDAARVKVVHAASAGEALNAVHIGNTEHTVKAICTQIVDLRAYCLVFGIVKRLFYCGNILLCEEKSRMHACLREGGSLAELRLADRNYRAKVKVLELFSHFLPLCCKKKIDF